MARKLVLSLLSAAAIAVAGIGLFPPNASQVVASESDTTIASSTTEDQKPIALDTRAVREPANPDHLAAVQLASTERWGVERVRAVDAIQVAGDMSRVIVAVIDTGIDDSQGALAGRVLASINLTGSGSIDDENGHGTHMAGTIAAVAPNAALLNIKSADKRGRCDPETVATAIRWAANHGALVINVSLEVSPSPSLQEAVRYAWQKGAIVIAAAGNGGSSAPAYPAAYAEAIAVAGTNQTNGLAVLSNHGEWVDIAAPGYKIYSNLPGGEYGIETGTSAAAAHVSGVAALLCGIAEDRSDNGFINDEVRYALESGASPLAVGGTGSGIVNAVTAVHILAV